MFERDYTINGKHATQLKFLAIKNSKEDVDEPEVVNPAKIFERYIDVYMNAVIWGLLYTRKEKKDNESNDRARIYADAFAIERNNCIFLYRLVMLLDETSNLTAEERIDRAFRHDETSPDYKDNMELFHDYVRGGIEQMFELFTNSCSNRREYLKKTYEVMSEFKKDIGEFSYKDELPKLINQTQLNLNM